jgi:uncharacterized membrane protein YgcG
MKMKQKMFALIVAAALLFSVPAFAAQETADNRVFDSAGLFTAEVADTLQAAVIDFQENTGYDFAVVIPEVDTGAGDYQQICDDFYQAKSLGMGMNHTAIICYLDLHSDSSYYYFVAVYGDLMNLMVNEDILYLANSAVEYFNQADFAGGLIWTVNMLSEALMNIGNMNTLRVYDYAQVLSAQENESLETDIAAFREKTGMDFLFLSTDEALENNEDGAYAIDFYRMHGFGAGERSSGVLVYLDFSQSHFFIQNFGDMDTYVSQEALNVILEANRELLKDGKIYEAVRQMIGSYSEHFQ